jgi:putative membrane protein
VKTLLRWVANSIAFYLALYLVDSLVAPRFWVKAVWIAILAALFLGLLNSLIRPLYRVRSKPMLAIAETVFTVAINALVLQVLIWVGAPLSATNVVWVFIAAAFLALLGGTNNWLIGFKQKEKPGSIARERRTERSSAQR